MPTTLTIPLTSSEPLFFDEGWPLEELFLEMLAKSQTPASLPRTGRLKPYTLSPIWREQRRGVPGSGKDGQTGYYWRVCLLDEALRPFILDGLKAAGALNLDGCSLGVGQVAVDELSYERLARRARAGAEAKPEGKRLLELKFVTPVILRRHGIPMPLPDPVLIFHHYLHSWDTFAPPELWVNINVLDAIEAHLGLIEHQLETRPVSLAGEGVKTGFLGQATYKMMAWEKLGVEFLGTLQMLARFAEFCGTGELTWQGLGQTRYGNK